MSVLTDTLEKAFDACENLEKSIYSGEMLTGEDLVTRMNELIALLRVIDDHIHEATLTQCSAVLLISEQGRNVCALIAEAIVLAE